MLPDAPLDIAMRVARQGYRLHAEMSIVTGVRLDMISNTTGH